MPALRPPPAGAFVPEHEVKPSDEMGPVYSLEMPGPLYGPSGPKASDVRQGEVGDCYFLSALAGLAAGHPELIQKAIQPAGATEVMQSGKKVVVHHYDVTLYARHPPTDASAPLEPVTVRVDDTIPCRQVEWDNFRSFDPMADAPAGAKWAALFEKAFAALDPEGYAGIGRGGSPVAALEQLTGVRADGLSRIEDATPEAVFAQIDAALHAGKVVCTNTFFNDSPANPKSSLGIGNVLEHLGQEGKVPLGADGQARYQRGFKYDDDIQGNALVPGHAYTVLGTEVKDGKKFVMRRNPLGGMVPAKWAETADDHGRFAMPLEDFVCLYDLLYTSGPLGS
jgi:hypothetical protein